MVDMKETHLVGAWDGCDSDVATAIDQFRDRWGPYSTSSRRYPIIRLIEELIDPALAAYMAKIPAHYLNYVPGVGAGTSFSEIIRLVGFDAMTRLQKELLRKFLRVMEPKRARDRSFVATLESLIDLVWSCAGKQPKRSKVRDSFLNGERAKGFCRLCGSLAELTSFAGGDDDPKVDDSEETLRLSTLYCLDHRPKLSDGSWNPAYRKAKRSQVQFDLELERLSRQSANLGRPQARSGDPLVDAYILQYVGGHTMLQPADKAELRNLARLMVDSQLSDRKKQMLMLLRSGQNQSEIARRLAIERQAVSKALVSIPAVFRLDKSGKRFAR